MNDIQQPKREGGRSSAPSVTVRGMFLVALLSLAGCTSIAFHVPDREWESDLVRKPGAVTPELESTSSPLIETRQQCRIGPRPSGWVAVTYLRLGEECAAFAETPFNGVLLQKYRGRPVNSVMEICADQMVPRGWIEVSPAEGDCVGAKVGENRPRAIRIRRVG